LRSKTILCEELRPELLKNRRASVNYHIASPMFMSQTREPPRAPEILASYVGHDIELNASHAAAEWNNARPVVFYSDWQGKNPDPGRQTTVRVLWTQRTLYLRFECRYRELYSFSDAEPNGRRDHLWDRDVAEAFLQPDPSRARFYKEFEVSPNGMWIDLDISPKGLADLKSGLQRSVFLDERAGIWTAELAIPLKALTSNFDSNAVWRANFYRIEGTKEPRTYLAWQPTGSPQPNFHVPSAFGKLRFAAPTTR
jgi:alpha-galactosidase